MSTALFTSLIVGAVCIVLSLCFLDELLVLLGATETILHYARAYGAIFIGGSIFNIFNVTVNHTITAEGASKLTMVAMATGGILNVILDPILIYTLNMGVSGAAIATVISQAATSCIYLWYLLSRKGVLRFSPRLFSPSKATYVEILKIGIPGFLFQLLTSTSMGLTNTAASAYGDAAVAAMGISIRVLTVGNYVIFGFMRGFQPVAGFSFGAKLYDRLKEAVNTVLKWATWFCGVAALLMFLFAPAIASAFSGDAEVVAIAAKALRANAVMFVFYGLQVVYCVLFMATGKAKEGSILSLSRSGIFFLPAIFLLPAVFGLNGVIFAQPIADFLTVALTVVIALRANRSIYAEKGASNIITNVN